MVKHMKWWGWGEESIAFTHDDKPALAPFIETNIGIDVTRPATSQPDFEKLRVDPPILTEKLKNDLEKVVGANNATSESMDRVVHTYGKSLRDLLRIRNGDLGRLPDVVVYPANEDEVGQIVRIALEENAVIIPFGGGTNIAGSLEAPRDEKRTVISLGTLTTGANPSRRVGPLTRSSTASPRIHAWTFSGQLQSLNSRRLDRDAFFRTAVR
jgi:alkyldihydroxyacetonephosphate synthase